MLHKKQLQNSEDTRKENEEISFPFITSSVLEKKCHFLHQRNISSCKYFSVTIRKSRVNVSAILKNGEITGPSYWKAEELPVSECQAYKSHVTLPAMLDGNSVYYRQLRTKLKLGSCKVFQTVECGLQILQGMEKQCLPQNQCFVVQHWF